jgi:hypothetical protein
MDLSEDFRPIATKYAIVSFVEEDVFGKLGRVVSEFTASGSIPLTPIGDERLLKSIQLSWNCHTRRR